MISQEERKLGQVLNNTLEKLKPRLIDGQNIQGISLDGTNTELSKPSQSLCVIGEAHQGQVAESGIGIPHGKTDVTLYKIETLSSGGQKAETLHSLLNSLPSTIKHWLVEWRDRGWMAGSPPNGSEAETREAMKQVFRLWGERDDGRLTQAVMGVLVVYGYGAMPSDPAQALVKVNVFKMALSDEPVWAVEQACKWWVMNKSQAPTPSEILSRTKFEKGYYDKFMEIDVGMIYDKLTTWLKDNKNG